MSHTHTHTLSHTHTLTHTGTYTTPPQRTMTLTAVVPWIPLDGWNRRVLFNSNFHRSWVMRVVRLTAAPSRMDCHLTTAWSVRCQKDAVATVVASSGLLCSLFNMHDLNRWCGSLKQHGSQTKLKIVLCIIMQEELSELHRASRDNNCRQLERILSTPGLRVYIGADAIGIARMRILGIYCASCTSKFWRVACLILSHVFKFPIRLSNNCISMMMHDDPITNFECTISRLCACSPCCAR
jgi:hypothetical protein